MEVNASSLIPVSGSKSGNALYTRILLQADNKLFRIELLLDGKVIMAFSDVKPRIYQKPNTDDTVVIDFTVFVHTRCRVDEARVINEDDTISGYFLSARSLHVGDSITLTQDCVLKRLKGDNRPIFTSRKD